MPVIHNLDIPAESDVPDAHVPLFVERGWIEGPGPFARDDFGRLVKDDAGNPVAAEADDKSAKSTKKTTKTDEKDDD